VANNFKKGCLKSIPFFLLIFITQSIIPSSIYIIIHGTWGLETSWYAPDGDFFDALECTAQKDGSCVVPFCWSGNNSIEARQKAANNLVKLIDSYPPNTTLIIIAHSHGGTVALLAAQYLKKNKIFCLYTLGTPINKALYPNMDTIHYCYNLFSFEDVVQTVLGMFDREYAAHERIANIRVIINDKEPDHTELHHPIIGAWIPELHNIIKNFGIKNEPGIIHVNDTEAPYYSIDTERQRLLERDRQISLLMLHSLRNQNYITEK